MKAKDFNKFFHICEATGWKREADLSQVATEKCGKYLSLITCFQIPSLNKTHHNEFSSRA